MVTTRLDSIDSRLNDNFIAVSFSGLLTRRTFDKYQRDIDLIISLAAFLGLNNQY